MDKDNTNNFLTPIYPVKDLLTDLNDMFTDFGHHLTYDFQVYSEYINTNTYKIHIQRLDINNHNGGWDMNISILACNNVTSTSNNIIHPLKIHNLEKSISNHQVIEVKTTYDIEPSITPVQILEPYTIVRAQEPRAISREEFNQKFNTDIVILPSNIFAAGLNNGEFLMYNTEYSHYHESIQQIKHVISVYLTKHHNNSSNETNTIPPFYFLFCGDDGYMEGHYLENRTISKTIGENDYIGHKKVVIENPSEYPVLHKNKYVLTQSQHLNLPYAIGITDRHYYFCNMYNAFRSFHRGLSFDTKINKIVYAGRPERGSKWNFIERRDLGNIHPRQYFWSDAISKENIYTSDTQWIDSKEMVNYKYILDIDGRAATWDATAWKLNSGSVILKQDSPWRQWFYDDFKPWVHYVPIKNDFSDIQEKYIWLETHQEECKNMIENCMNLFQQIYRFQNIVKYTENVISTIENSENL